MTIFTRDPATKKLRPTKPEDTPAVWRHVDARTDRGPDASAVDRLHDAILLALRAYSRITKPFPSDTGSVPRSASGRHRRPAVRRFFAPIYVPDEWQRLFSAITHAHSTLMATWNVEFDRAERHVQAKVRELGLDRSQGYELRGRLIAKAPITVAQILGPRHQDAADLFELTDHDDDDLPVPDAAMQQRLVKLAEDCLAEHGRSWRHLSKVQQARCSQLVPLFRQHKRLTASEIARLLEHFEWGTSKSKGRPNLTAAGQEIVDLVAKPVGERPHSYYVLGEPLFGMPDGM